MSVLCDFHFTASNASYTSSVIYYYTFMIIVTWVILIPLEKVVWGKRCLEEINRIEHNMSDQISQSKKEAHFKRDWQASICLIRHFLAPQHFSAGIDLQWTS